MISAQGTHLPSTPSFGVSPLCGVQPPSLLQAENVGLWDLSQTVKEVPGYITERDNPRMPSQGPVVKGVRSSLLAESSLKGFGLDSASITMPLPQPRLQAGASQLSLLIFILQGEPLCADWRPLLALWKVSSVAHPCGNAPGMGAETCGGHEP